MTSMCDRTPPQTATPRGGLSAISRNPTRESLHLLARLSLAAYSAETVGQDPAWYDCTRAVPIIDAASGMKAIVMADAFKIVVAIAGTEPLDWKDWRRDADVALVEHEKLGGRVHRGFKRGWDAISPKVQAVLDDLNHPCSESLTIVNQWGDTRRVKIPVGGMYMIPTGWSMAEQEKHFGTGRRSRQLVFTGHSMGGGAGALAAAELDADLCVTFGAPCMCDAWFAKLFDVERQHKHLRVVHGNDIVTRLLQPIDDYRHCGTEIYLDRKSRIRPDHPRAKVIADRVIRFRFDMVRDHLLGRYLEALS